MRNLCTDIRKFDIIVNKCMEFVNNACVYNSNKK